MKTIPKISTSERNGIVNPTLGELVYDKDEDTMFMWNANMGWIMAGSAISFTNFVDANKNTSLFIPIKDEDLQTIFINESGLYSLILGSKKDESKHIPRTNKYEFQDNTALR